ncbi:MAG TPA: response regulator [Verrucomicrobiae bacterium]|nr:response regulator [Verrucomicrobiae bacterium]
MTRPHVLLIEDYPDNRVLVSAVLGDAGWAVSVAEDAPSCDRQLAQGLDPDLFLIDLSLPGEDGWSLVRRLRQDPRWRERPMVALTAHAMDGDARRGLRAGFDGYLTKPIDLGTFPTTLSRWLRTPSPAEGG